MPGMPGQGTRIAPAVTKPVARVAPRSRTQPGATHLGYGNASRFAHRPRESEHPVDLETVTQPRGRLRPSHVPGAPKPKSPPSPGNSGLGCATLSAPCATGKQTKILLRCDIPLRPQRGLR